jgi:hypothetical protein
MNGILICWSCSQIFEMFRTFKGLITYLHPQLTSATVTLQLVHPQNTRHVDFFTGSEVTWNPPAQTHIPKQRRNSTDVNMDDINVIRKANGSWHTLWFRQSDVVANGVHFVSWFTLWYWRIMQDTGRIPIKCQLLFVLADWFWAEIYYYSYERHTQETNWNNAICAHKLYPTRRNEYVIRRMERARETA